MKVCTLPYCILLCCVWWITLGGLFFSEEKWRIIGPVGKGAKGGGGLGELEGRETGVRMYYMRENK